MVVVVVGVAQLDRVPQSRAEEFFRGGGSGCSVAAQRTEGGLVGKGWRGVGGEGRMVSQRIKEV